MSLSILLDQNIPAALGDYLRNQKPQWTVRHGTTIGLSLEQFSGEELVEVWAEEAQRRDAEMDADPDAGIPAKQAFRKARAGLS